MKSVYFWLLKSFVLIFFISLFFFIFIFQLLDIFSNIYHYVNFEVSAVTIGQIALYYTPKCIIYSLPISLLFSIIFTLGNLYMNNELIAVFGSGISLYKFVIPLVIAGVFLSPFMFFFEDQIVIPTLREKNIIQRQALNQSEPYSDNNIGVKTADGKIIYQANHFKDSEKQLIGMTILIKDDDGDINTRYEVQNAFWNDRNWVLNQIVIYKWNDNKNIYDIETTEVLDDPKFAEPPDVFKKLTRNIEEMNLKEAESWISDLRKAGRSYEASLSEYYKKYSFSLTPIIVALISCSVGGLLKKNVLLMSLFLSISIVVIYFVFQLLLSTFASNGMIPPFWGAWSPFLLFCGVGIILVKSART
ncbi:MAG: LptF/LptG family permease [Spirochaetales bacterium]|nr:LptF/LptG family permease [Spirochaetales bacterium]